MDGDLDRWCLELSSQKVRPRKEACEQVKEFLGLKSALDYLRSTGGAHWWSELLNSIFSCMIQDHAKQVESKRKSIDPFNAPPSVDLFALFIKVAIKENAELNVLQLIQTVIKWLQDNEKKQFHDRFLKILTESVLNSDKIRSSLKEIDWERLYHAIKALCNEGVITDEKIKCFAIVLKNAPLHNFPTRLYRHEFTYLATLPKKVTALSTTVQHEAILDIISSFCKNTAKDNRMICCKLGEDTFKYCIDLYQDNPNELNLKTQLIEFFHLQVVLHNPKGVKVGHPAAYAASWDFWHCCLHSIYSIFSNEIDANVKLITKNQSLFVTKNGADELLGAFVKLFVEVCKQLFDDQNPRDDDEPPRKRLRTDESSITNLITKITQTRSWAWLNLTYPLIEAYPEIITKDAYVKLLKILSSFQTETTDSNLLHHVNKALIVLLKIKNMTGVKIDFWRRVSDTAIRLINQNDANIQTLLQLLIINKYPVIHENILECYKPGSSLKLDENSLKTIDVVFKNSNLQFDKISKTQTIDWILTNLKQFNEHQVAEILVCLIKKQWPERNFTFNETKKQFSDIEDIYFSVCYDNLVIPAKSVKTKSTAKNICIDQSLLEHLTNSLKTIIDGLATGTEDFCNINILMFNVISFLHAHDLVGSELYDIFITNIEKLFASLDFKNDLNEFKFKQLATVVQSLCTLLRNNSRDFLAKKLRESASEGLIRDIIGILNLKGGFIRNEAFRKLRKLVMEMLVIFSCLPTFDVLSIQSKVFQALVSCEYNFAKEDDYELVLTLLRCVMSCKPKKMSQKSLSSIFDILQKFCEVKFYCNNSAVEVLDFFYVIYPVVVTSCSVQCKTNYIGILYPFFMKRSSYEPAVSIKLLKCMGLIYQLDPLAAYTTWSNEEIILKIPEFLTSDYQEVRFIAIKSIAMYFHQSSKLKQFNQFHKQEIMFAKIYKMSLKVLEVETTENPDETRLLDEVVSRSSSIFHTYAAIMVSSNLWTEEALFTLLKIISDKNLALNLDQLMRLIAENLGFKSNLRFLEKFLAGLVTRFYENFDAFPFALFNCSGKIDLFTKYWPLLAHIFIKDANNSVNQVASRLGKSLQVLIEETCTRLLVQCIAQERADLSLIHQNRTYQLLQDTLGVEKIHEVFKDNVEEGVMCLISFVSDEVAFKRCFDEGVIFPKSTEIRLKVAEFNECLNFVEATLYDEDSVISILMRRNPEKIHFILTQLNLRINSVQALEDKQRYFHIYTLIASLFIDSVITEESMQPYLIRDLTHTLLHHIKAHKTQPELSKMSCKFFKIMLQKILPALSDNVAEFFLIIISRLKYVALEQCSVSSFCVEMLELLIVTHKDLFITEISKLDSIPRTAEFSKIADVHNSVKYNDRKVTLEDEIIQFLDFTKNIESLDECEHSLTHLKTLLSENKAELRAIYATLRESRGLSEDCERSNLHKLICMLIILSCSTNQNVSVEAVRCLGEIGPADLATLILQPEKVILGTKWTPWELVLGCAVSLLSKYLIDSDVDVIKASSVALFQIISTKEGRKVAESEHDFGFGAIHLPYLTPFCAMSLNKGKFKPTVNGDYFISAVQQDELWIPDHSCHETWITRLVTLFLESFEQRDLFDTFIGVCKLKVEFCEQILPILVYMILFLNNFSFTTIIAQQIATFFKKHWDTTITNSKENHITTNKSSVQTMLNIINFIRLQKSVRKEAVRDMKLNYLQIAKAANFCSAHFTALLYAELWCQEQINQSEQSNVNEFALSTCKYTKLDLLYEKLDDVDGNALQDILRQAYKSVGESDALLGCGTSHLLNPASRVEHYKELGRWDQVTQFFERQVSLGRKVAMRPLVDSLKSANLYQMSLFCADASGDANYECLWRLGQWKHSEKGPNENTYEKSKFHAFKALVDKEDFAFIKAMDDGRVCVVDEFIAANMESIKNFYNTFTKLQCLKEIEEFADVQKGASLQNLLIKWKIRDDIICNDYQECVQAQRILLLTHVLKTHQSDDLKQMILDTVIGYAQCARIEGNSHVAFRILDTLRLLDVSADLDARIKLEEAQLCWRIEDAVSAKCLLKQLCTSDDLNPKLHAMALKLTGRWMAESSSESRQNIIDNYFKKSLDMNKKITDRTDDDVKALIDTYEQLATFADHEYQEVMSHIKSDVFQKKKQNMKKSKDLVDNFKADRITKDLQKAIAIKKKLSTIDEIEVRNIEIDMDNMLVLALKFYLKILLFSDDHDMTVFRFFSLLLENPNNTSVKTILEKQLLKIPTYKYINILPQIIPHICNPNDVFSTSVKNLIIKCAKDHPYHTLPLILSLALSNKDREYSKEAKAATNDTRAQNAKSIIETLEKETKLAAIIKKMQFVSEAIIELAYYQNDGGNKLKVPRTAKIRKIQNFDDVLLPTFNLQVNKALNYANIIGIMSFSDVYYNVGGINAPKRITCTGTDGLMRTQLIKGQDDLRQDAVMQQVFTIMNKLLHMNKQTKNLRIRTYKIVPVSMRSGILEWVDNTMPIGEYLVGENGEGGAHVKFRPDDATPHRCKTEYKNSASGKSNEQKLRAFNKICEKIKPVFHKFFETQFPQPTVWYERRRNYIHSVAVSSMCGYFLGIGDRHVNNILIDKNSAEVVHIDFGIAFEQGRVLPTPETVPFRLTRDMVDGMGVSGVEGVFRRSCEKTVEVFRLHYQTIITILEVLLYDPLYDWTVSFAEANKRQKDDDSQFSGPLGEGGSDESASRDVNETAERALLRLRSKLQGTETGKSSSVEHQVGTLIQQAVDPLNLSRLFYGWQPYL